MELRDIFIALERPIYQMRSIKLANFVIDSRDVVPGSVFVAFQGERDDGHNYVSDAFNRGAQVAIIERDVVDERPVVDLRKDNDSVEFSNQTPVCLRVHSSLNALQEIAAYWRARHRPRVIGITGSVGKTTTKEVIHTVLQNRFRTLKSPGNLNNEIGLPLTLTQLDASFEHVVLEMGMYAEGEIARLAEIARPHVGVVTNVGPVHLERLGSLSAIARAKTELVKTLPVDGVAILNHDEPLVRDMAEHTKARVFTYGLSPEADLWADEIVSAGLNGIHFNLHYQGETINVRVPLLGRHSVHTALRATAVGLVEGMQWQGILSGLAADRTQLRLVAIPGPRNSWIFDDTYNASPASSIAALNLLEDLEGRKVAIMGDMLELGTYEDTGHRMVGRRAAQVADQLITVGDLGRVIGEEAHVIGMQASSIVHADTVDQAIEITPSILQDGDMVLVKGSRGVGLDRLVNALTQRTEPARPYDQPHPKGEQG